MLLFDKKCPNCQTYHDATLFECPTCHKSNELYAQRDVSSRIVFLHPLAQIGLFLAGFAYAGMLICELIVSLFLVGISSMFLAKSLIVFFTYLFMAGALLSIPLSTRRKDFLKSFAHPKDYAFAALIVGMLLASELLIKLIISTFYSGDLSGGNQDDAVNMITNYPILMFFAFCFLGPICEELTYRLGLHSFLSRINKILAICVSALVFALVHLRFTNSGLMKELLSLPIYFTCGIILSLAYEYRGLACSLAAHMIYNTIAFITVLTAL